MTERENSIKMQHLRTILIKVQRDANHTQGFEQR